MQSNTYTSPKWIILLGLILAFSNFKLLWNPPPGLENAEPIGAFINGNLPSQRADGDINATPIYTNIDWISPIVATPLPGTNNMLIVEMDGRFFSVSSNENTSSRTTVLDIQDRSWYYNWNSNNNSTKHGGIQNVVFHPQFGQGQGKDYMYVYYVHNENNDAANAAEQYYDRLSRFTWNGSSFNPNSELILINQYDTRKGHDGSGMFFGTDGFLYVAVGDEGNSENVTQQIDFRFRSGVWRIDVDKRGGNVSHPIIRQPSNANVPAGATASYTQEYYIPNNNPFVNPNGSVLEEYYALGLRQPFRMTQDVATGNIWIGDVGAGGVEEVDLIDKPGLNFQWDYKEGFDNGRNGTPNQIIGEEREPLLALTHGDGWSAIIGGYVYTGSAIPQLTGKYIYANNGTNGNIYALTHTAGNVADEVELIATKPDAGGTFTGISSFGLDHNNELLVLKLGTTVGAGRIYKLTENGSSANLAFPDKLSQTGIFSNLANLTPVQGIIPYDVNNPLWSAGTDKKRWVAIPNDGNVNTNNERIAYSENGNWGFPIGTVFIKHFGQPDGKKLETRVWMHGTDGTWFGTTYRWNNAGTDADLLLAGLEENITIDGETFPYLYPSTTQCQTCHTDNSGDVLGFRTHQLNRDILYPTSGLVGNQLETFAQLGFIPTVNTTNVTTSYALGDNSKSLEVRARSYFDSNCSHCHQPGGNRAIFDARYNTPLAQQALINGELIDDLGITGGRVITPQSTDLSILYQRINSTEGCCAMPPLARGRVDKEGVQLVANWINSIGADCANSSSVILGNTLSDGNFVDGHNPALNINKSDTYTNSTNAAQEICLVDFSFYARREGNPVTPFIVRVNGTNNFTIIAIGQTRTSGAYNVGNNSFAFSNHSDDVIVLQPGETIATGFMDAFPDGSGATTQSVIPAQNAAGEDAVWQTFTNGSQLPSLTLGESPGLAGGVAANLTRTYKFNISIDVGEVVISPPPPPSGMVTLYKHCGFGGTSISLAAGEYSNIANEGFLNNDLSSIKIPTGFQVILYAETNFGGNAITLTADDDCLTDNGFNDNAASLKILSLNGCTDADNDGVCVADDCDDNNAAVPATVGNNCNDGNANTTNDVIQSDGCTCAGTPVQNVSETTLYKNCAFGGTSITLGEGEYPNIANEGFLNNDLSSIKIPTGFQVILYAETNFGGNAITLTADDDCLTDNGFNDDAASLKIVNLDNGPSNPNCTTHNIPGRIEAEDFCSQQGVVPEATGDVGGGQNIGNVQNGDWMEYQINVATAGTYQVDYRVAARNASGGIIQLQINGTAIGSRTIPSTGAWQTYTTVSNEVNLPAGSNTLRVFAEQQGWNLNWMEFSPINTNNAQSFIPDPNKTYYLDVPAHNLRLAATGQSEDAYTTSTNTTGADVAWKFVDKGNGYWHLQRAAGGAVPRLRTDATLNADMQATSSAGVYTYYRFDRGATSETHYLTLPDGPVAFQRLQMISDGELRFVPTTSSGTSVSWRITEITNNGAGGECQCASGANSLLVNGSFEETSNPNYNSAYDLIEAIGNNNSGVKFIDRHPDTDFPGWFTTGGNALQQGGFSQGGTLELGQTGFLGFEAPDGDVYAEMDGNNHNQIISVTPGQVLDWELSHRGRPGTDEITISVGPVGNQSVVDIVTSPNTAWIRHTGQYTVPNGVTEIQFTIIPSGAANGDTDSSNLLDNVKVCPSNDPPMGGGGCAVAAVPARIQAEDYCDQFGVQAEPTGDVGGGENIGFIAPGDWMEYEINVPAAGTYGVDYRVAANNASGGIIQLQINGSSIGNISIPSTGGWQTYTTVSNQVSLPAGRHTLRVFAQQAGWNLNWIEIHNWDGEVVNEETPENEDNTTTESCDNGTSITYGNGSITMEGGSFYQILDQGWNEVYNCGWQCGNSKTVNDLVAGDYRIYIKDNTYQVVCEKVITLSANNGGGGNGGGGDPDNDGDGVPASQDCNDNDANLTTIGATCNDGDNNTENDVVQANCTCLGTATNTGPTGNDTNTTCGELAVTYGNGEIAITGLANKAYFFKVNDLDNGWADAGNCGWNCGNEFTVANLSNGRYLITVYNDDWSIHCETEITMTGSSITSSAEDRQAAHLSFTAYPANRTIDLQWLSNSGFKVRNFEVEHSEDGTNFEQMVQLVNKDWSSTIAYHQTTDATPLVGANYYRVKEIYLDDSFAYTDVQQVNFQIDLTKVSVFPNPAKDKLFLNLTPYVGKKATLSLVDHLGKQLINQDIATVSTDLISMNTTQIQNGLYYLIIDVDGQKPFTKKVLIHRLY